MQKCGDVVRLLDANLSGMEFSLDGLTILYVYGSLCLTQNAT